jgi:hypothetical protein
LPSLLLPQELLRSDLRLRRPELRCCPELRCSGCSDLRCCRADLLRCPGLWLLELRLRLLPPPPLLPSPLLPRALPPLLLPQELLLRIVVLLPSLLPRLAACLLHQDLLLRNEQLRLRLR